MLKKIKKINTTIKIFNELNRKERPFWGVSLTKAFWDVSFTKAYH